MKMGAAAAETTLLFISLMIILPLHHAYHNYTVGDSLGWYDPFQNPKLDYQKWASSHNFSLGDFLIFNTDNNHSVIQTYNFTTYKLCDYTDALDNDTLQWSEADPSSTAPHPVSVAVPLLQPGETYFFSSDYDGEQCLNGQRFQINVTHGEGLPPSLLPDDGSPSPTSPQSGDDDSAPDTLNSPYNFDDPKDAGDDDSDDGDAKTSNSDALSSFSKVLLHGLLVVIGFLF